MEPNFKFDSNKFSHRLGSVLLIFIFYALFANRRLIHKMQYDFHTMQDDVLEPILCVPKAICISNI
jgi:hypothetical protein